MHFFFPFCLQLCIFWRRKVARARFVVVVISAIPIICYFFVYSVKEMQSLPQIDRGTCCLSFDWLEDICGRKNCTLPSCSDQRQFSILEWKTNPQIERLSEKVNKAFFLETSGIGNLNFRQACAVESIAMHNPSMAINLFFMGGNINNSAITLQKLKEKYKNIQFISNNLDAYTAGTLLEHWYHCNDWRNGPFHVSHLSDGLRFLTLHKYGGYYFDLDVISVGPVTYYRNFVAAESDDYLGSGVMHADYKNPVIELALRDFVKNYRSDIWGHNGPALLLRVLKNWCKAKNLLTMDYVSCRGFNVLHYSSFCPIDCSENEELFIHRTKNETGKPAWLTKHVIGVHTWNKLTYSKPIYKNSTQQYTWLARINCPSIFAIAPEVF